MEWQSYPVLRPKETGPYIASISIPITVGHRIFSDSAYYNHESNKWYKYDAFTGEHNLDEEITGSVVGWINNLDTYLGSIR